MAGPNEFFALDFFTQSGSVSKHGTLSLADGKPKATWTSDNPSGKRTYDRPLTGEKFQKFWDGINDIRELRKFRVQSPDTKLDFTRNYIIAAVYSFSGQEGKTVFLIPHNCNDPGVLAWVREIESTGNE